MSMPPKVQSHAGELGDAFSCQHEKSQQTRNARHSHSAFIALVSNFNDIFIHTEHRDQDVCPVSCVCVAAVCVVFDSLFVAVQNASSLVNQMQQCNTQTPQTVVVLPLFSPFVYIFAHSMNGNAIGGAVTQNRTKKIAPNRRMDEVKRGGGSERETHWFTHLARVQMIFFSRRFCHCWCRCRWALNAHFFTRWRLFALNVRGR